MTATEQSNAGVSHETPLVSVIIPTHNRTHLLRQAIRSVLDQTYGNLEIIVVDDASSDNTHEVVADFADTRIRYIRHKKNRGGSAARNTGIRAATGEFIAFLDDDDEWYPQKTDEQMRLLQQYDAVLCTSNESIAGAGAYRGRSTAGLEDLRRGRFTAGGTGVLMVRSALMKEVLFDETLPCYQDWDAFIRLAQRCIIAYLDKPLLRYNEGAHSRISNKILDISPEDLEKRLLMLRKHQEFFGPRWFKRHLGRNLVYGIKHREHKMRHLLYAVSKCGVGAVAWALLRKVFPRLAEAI